MPMQIIRADITRVKADAIVNSANYAPTFAEGVDSQIYEAAGAAELLTEREKIGYLEIGEACVTPAFKLQAKYIFHVASPRWIDGNHNEIQMLRQCYDRVLALAVENNCASIAIPLLATGNFCFPQGVGLEVATSAIREFLHDHELDITLVVYNRQSFTLAQEIVDEVKAYIDENYIDEREQMLFSYREARIENIPEPQAAPHVRSSVSLIKKAKKRSAGIAKETLEKQASAKINEGLKCCDYEEYSNDISVDDAPCDDYEGRKYVPFYHHIIQIMNKKGIEKNSDAYNACGMSKQTWSKMTKPDYSPSKTTVMQLCIGLKLNMDEARDLMLQAGYAFSPNKKLDVVVQYCISKKLDIFDTDDIIFHEFGKTLSNCG